jgi:predicted ArsR family transcriptional regulator
MHREPLEDSVSGVAALDHPISRRAYQLVRDHGEIGRDAAAEALAVARSVVAFHLDKLVDAGLLEARYERLSGRSGPGAGRPAKLYTRSSREIDVSIPPRRYDLAGSVLADAISRATKETAAIDQSVSEVARETGFRIGAGAARRSDASSGAEVVSALEHLGYEPHDTGDEIALFNCPFHSLAEQHRALVCGMNLDLVGGILDGLGATDGGTARLAPEPGYCCVRIARN